MIESKDGMVNIQGNHNTIFADLVIIIKSLCKYFDEDEVKEAVRLGFMSMDDIAKENERLQRELANLMMEMMPREDREAMVREILTGMKGNE